MFDGQDSRISSLTANSPSSGYTTITLTTSPLSTDQLNGRELVIARPTNAGDRYITATINDTTANTIVVVDAGGSSAPVYLALNGQTQGFIVYDFNDKAITNAPTYSTGGKWTSAPSHSSGATTLTDSGAAFITAQIGWVIEVDAEFPQYTLTVLGRTSGTQITVKGDVTTLCASGSRYRLYPPPGADASNGALKFDVNENGSMYLWASYRFIPPMIGVDVSGTIYGAQVGANKLGLYHCWNRYDDPAVGRWTTPDPLAMPWTNLVDYCLGNVIQQVDPNGLLAQAIPAAVTSAAVSAFLKAMGVSLLICLVWDTCREGLISILKKFGKTIEDLFKKSPDPAPIPKDLPKPDSIPKIDRPSDPVKDFFKGKGGPNPPPIIIPQPKDEGRPWPTPKDWPKPDRFPPPPKPDEPDDEDQIECTCEKIGVLCEAQGMADTQTCSACASECIYQRKLAKSKGWDTSYMYRPDHWPHGKKVNNVMATGVAEVGPCPDYRLLCPKGVK